MSTASVSFGAPRTTGGGREAGPHAATRLLLVGTGERAARVASALIKGGSQIIGTVDRESLPHLESEVPGVRRLGSLDQMGSVALAHGAEEICVALPLRSCFDEWRYASSVGRELGIPVSFHFDADLIGDAGRVQFSTLADTTLLRCNVHPTTIGVAPFYKRLFDVVGAAIGLVVLAPILTIAAILVKATSPGPILFRQPRVGRGRRVFGMLKFRTMVHDAEARRSEVQDLNHATGIMFKIAHDPRLTPVGRFLRRTSIDELPQLINVLRGEMSMVGPRPIPIWVYEQIEEPQFYRRFSVLPGMTGLWQVHGRPQEYRLMSFHDLQYVDRWSFLLDIKILCRTVPAVLHRHGAQ